MAPIPFPPYASGRPSSSYICMLQEGDNAGNSFTGFCGLPAVQRDYEMSGMHAGTKRRKYIQGTREQGCYPAKYPHAVIG